MAKVEMILYLYFIFLQLTFVTAQITWENCENESTDIKLLNLTVTPYPILLPGSLSIELAVHTDQEITSPLKADLTLEKKILFGYVSVPCISGIGSCKYDDLCTTCRECGCPLKTGDHVVKLPITIDTSSWVLFGNYQARVHIETKSGQKGCVKVNNVHIQSSK